MPAPMERAPARPSPRRLAFIYRIHFEDPRRERLFLSSLSFFLAFAVVRVVTHGIKAQIGPFHNVSAGGVHVHHLVFGIVLLLATGYLWLLQLGTGMEPKRNVLSTLTPIAFGVGSALTLDEFALWLNLRDVYWERQGRESVDAVVLFGSLLSVGIFGGPFLRALGRESVWVLHHLRRGPSPGG